jgi:hypothetical protein
MSEVEATCRLRTTGETVTRRCGGIVAGDVLPQVVALVAAAWRVDASQVEVLAIDGRTVERPAPHPTPDEQEDAQPEERDTAEQPVPPAPKPPKPRRR